MWADLAAAFAFLTVLPVPGSATETGPGRTFAYYPLVGLAIGLAVAGISSITTFSADISAFLALFVWIVLTGGLHLDGFADSCDGLLATVSPERRLEIMKDPRAESWALVGVLLLLLGKWVALREVSPALLILPPVMGRWALVLAVWALPYARASGLGAYFRAGFGRLQLYAAALLTAVIAGLAAWPGALVIAVPFVIVAVVGRWAARRLGGGLTGDVYGALCELTEVICLIMLSAV